MVIISREEACRIGQPWYFTGRPCKRGHVAKRNTANYSCRGCKTKDKQAKVDSLEAEQDRRKEFHKQWMAEFRKRKAEARANGKRALDLLS